MGIYVYNVRRSGSKSVMIDGSTAQVHTCKFTCRESALPSRAWSAWERKMAFPYDMVYGRIEQAWAGQKPEYVVIEGDNKVYRWTGGLTWVDCNSIPGVPVGKLVKKGRRWVVEALEGSC